MPLGRRLYFLGRFLEGAGAGAVAVATFLSGYPHFLCKVFIILQKTSTMLKFQCYRPYTGKERGKCNCALYLQVVGRRLVKR